MRHRANALLLSDVLVQDAVALTANSRSIHSCCSNSHLCVDPFAREIKLHPPYHCKQTPLCTYIFQLSFRPSVSGTASWTTVSVGRIGRYDHVPAQVCLEPSEFEAGVGDLKWIVSVLEQQVQATCFQKVFCTLENQDSVACLQFLIPQSIDKRLPLHWDVGGRQMCVDHPAAFAVPLSISRRPPEEQDKFDHWKETANRSFSYRKGRQNSLSHCPKLVDSICRFNLLRHGDILSNGKRFAAMFETDFLPFLFVDGKPNIEDLLDFCGDVSSDNATVGTGFATMSADDHLCQAADIQSEAPVLYVLDVLQDRQDPLKIGRFLLTRKQFFASTSETLLCHAFSACTVALVVPKGSTVDQICGPRDSYDVLKRIPLQCVPAQSRIAAGVDPPKSIDVGIAPKPRDDGAGQPRARTTESKVQPPSVAVSPTVPWTQNDNGPGSQMPKPVKSATPKSDEDVPMGEVEGPDQLKGIGSDKSNNETKHEELGNVVQGCGDAELPPIRKEIVTAQASPLKRASHPVRSQTGGDPSNSSGDQNLLARAADQKQEAPLGLKDCDEPSFVKLNGTLPPGKAVVLEPTLPKNPSSSTLRPGSRASCTHSKQNVAKERKIAPRRSSGLLAEAFRNAQNEHPLNHDAPLLTESALGNDEQSTLHIDLTGNNDDPIEDEVHPDLLSQVNDAIEKWYPDLDRRTKREDIALASTFLRYMNSTLCFLTVSFRMLLKAPWKSKMLTAHVRQAALAAIGNGWFVWAGGQSKLPFTRAELALAAVSYRGCLEPKMPDPAQSIFAMVDCLPIGIGCEESFCKAFFYRVAERAVKHCRSSRTTTRGRTVKQKTLALAKEGNQNKQHKPQTKQTKNPPKHKTNEAPRQVPEDGETREPQVRQ